MTAQSSTLRRLWITGCRRAELREEPRPQSQPGHVLLQARFSGISRGSERLVFEGAVPESEFERMRAPFQKGDFPFPVSYGYCFVGTVADGPDAGSLRFALHPHADLAFLPADAAVPVPAGVPARRAVLAANVETALNALWDAGAGPGDRIAVVGAGLVGACVASIAAQLPGARVELIDIDDRSALARALGCAFAAPDDATGDADIVVHASASEAGLATALSLGGFEATIVEMSWYGEGRVAVPLGGAFHSRRLRLIASQVGSVSPARRPRWSLNRRLAAALDLLRDDRFDALLGEEIAFSDLPRELARILEGAGGLCPVVRYD